MEIILKNKSISMYSKPYIIAEACINHNGEFEIAKKMIEVASSIKVDCIKFQIHVLENEMLRVAPQSSNFDEPLWDTLEKTNFSLDEHRELKKICESHNIQYLCTPFSKIGADMLEELNVDFYKIGSGEMTNFPLIEHISKKGKPMIISTGMSELKEVEELVVFTKNLKIPFMLTHCTSAYPCPYERVNLQLIKKYNELFDVPIGLSDHTPDNFSSYGAVALGASVIEKHFTLDKNQIGPDHKSSIEPDALNELVLGCNAIFLANGNKKFVYPEEKEIISWARESVVSEVEIYKGQKIEEGMIWVKRPSPEEGCIPAKKYKDVIGRFAKSDIPINTQIKWSDLK